MVIPIAQERPLQKEDLAMVRNREREVGCDFDVRVRQAKFASLPLRHHFALKDECYQHADLEVGTLRTTLMAINITCGSGNVLRTWARADKAANLQLRSDLMIKLRKRLATLGTTQAEWAAVLGVSQPRISDVLCAEIDRFSIDTLISYLGETGAEV